MFQISLSGDGEKEKGWERNTSGEFCNFFDIVLPELPICLYQIHVLLLVHSSISFVVDHPPYLHSVTSEMWCSSWGRGILTLLSPMLCTIKIVHSETSSSYKNSLIRSYFDLAWFSYTFPTRLYLFGLHGAVYISLYLKFMPLFTESVPFIKLSLMGLALDPVD